MLEWLLDHCLQCIPSDTLRQQGRQSQGVVLVNFLQSSTAILLLGLTTADTIQQQQMMSYGRCLVTRQQSMTAISLLSVTDSLFVIYAETSQTLEQQKKAVSGCHLGHLTAVADIILAILSHNSLSTFEETQSQLCAVHVRVAKAVHDTSANAALGLYHQQ